MTTRTSILIGGGILGTALLGFVLLVALRPEPPKVEPTVEAPLVTVAEAEARTGPLRVRGTGTVRPVREINLVAEVSGRVVRVSEALKSGGFFRAGQTLLRIDPADYQNAVAVAEAEVTQRQFEVLTAREEVEAAREEWQRLERRTGVEGLPDSTALGRLPLREPQLRAAEARLQSATARLDDARTRLARTAVAAPFNGRVRQKAVDLGQFVGPGQVLATVYATDAVEVVVPLTTREAVLIDGVWTNRGRAPAVVAARIGDTRHTWRGVVDRTEGTLDPATRTVNAVVRVAAPYQTDPPLLVGTFAEVEFEGIAPDRYVALPRAALHDDGTVWLVEDGRLVVRPVTVVQEIDEEVYVTEGVAPGDRVITSHLAVFTDGMAVRMVER